MEVTVAQTTVDRAIVDEIIQGWSHEPRHTVNKLMDTYGLPNEATPTRIIWFNNGPWKRTIAFRDEDAHHFPRMHKDHLQQTIDYRVPLGKTEQLVEFNGSLLIDRTRGELSARCDREELNFLMLNLAHDIIAGRKDVDLARQEYARQTLAFMRAEPQYAPYVQGFNFNVGYGAAGDPDTSIIGVKDEIIVVTEKIRKDVPEE